MSIWTLFFLYAIVFVGSVGCKFGKPNPLDLANESFYAGDFSKTAELLSQEVQKDSTGSEDQVRLNLATAHVLEGNFKHAESQLRQVKNKQLSDPSVGWNLAAEGAALLTDQTVIPYRCRDYEQSFLPALLALISQVGDRVDVFAYCHQLESFCRKAQAPAKKTEEQKEASSSLLASADRSPLTSDESIAFSHFLLGLLRSQDALQSDVANRHFQSARGLSPSNPLYQEYFELSRGKRQMGKGNGTVTVISLVNPGPQFHQEVAEVPSAALLIATELISDKEDVSLPPAVAPVKIPELSPPSRPVHSIRLRCQYGVSESQIAWNVHQSAMKEFQQNRNWIIAKTVAARAVKKAVVQAGKEKMGATKGSGLSTVMDVAGVLWELSESADLRCWNFMPGEVHVNRMEVPKGLHQLEVQSVGSSGRGKPENFQVRVREGQNTIVLLFAPSQSTPIVVHPGS